MNLITRNEAHRLGHKRFFTGRACLYGHVVERYVSTGACVECLRGAAPSTVRFTVVSHVIDRPTIEQFVKSLAEARDLQALTVEGRDEQAYWQLIANYRKLGCPQKDLPRYLGTFRLPEGVEP